MGVRYICLLMDSEKFENYFKKGSILEYMPKIEDIFGVATIKGENNKTALVYEFPEKDNDVVRILVMLAYNKLKQKVDDVKMTIVSSEEVVFDRLPSPIPEPILRVILRISTFFNTPEIQEIDNRILQYRLYRLFFNNVDDKNLINDFKEFLKYITTHHEFTKDLIAVIDKKTDEKTFLRKYNNIIIPVDTEDMYRLFDSLVDVKIYKADWIVISVEDHQVFVTKTDRLIKTKTRKDGISFDIKSVPLLETMKVLPRVVEKLGLEDINEHNIEQFAEKLYNVHRILTTVIIKKITEKIKNKEISIFTDPTEESIVTSFVEYLISTSEDIFNVDSIDTITKVLSKMSGEKFDIPKNVFIVNKEYLVFPATIFKYYNIFSRKILDFLVRNNIAVAKRVVKPVINNKRRKVLLYVVEWNKLKQLVPSFSKLEEMSTDIDKTMLEMTEERKPSEEESEGRREEKMGEIDLDKLLEEEF